MSEKTELEKKAEREIELAKIGLAKQIAKRTEDDLGVDAILTLAEALNKVDGY